MQTAETLKRFDTFLEARGLRLEAVIIGGGALNLLGVVSRVTKDCDILSPPLPAEIIQAAREFASAERARGVVLTDEWLNNGPTSLADALPAAWQERVRLVFEGKSIVLHTLDRADLLRTKLFALCDRNEDLGDCVALAPSAAELRELLPWVERQDTNEDWPEYVRTVVRDLARGLGHEL